MKNLKACLMLLVLGQMAVLPAAEVLVDDAVYTLDRVPAELTARIAAARDVEFKLEEEPADGCQWIAVYDPRACLVSVEHRSGSKWFGKKGSAEVEIRALAATPSAVTLKYVRMPDISKALKTVVCQVNPAVPEAAPTAVPVLVDDSKYTLAGLQPVYRVTVPVGGEIDFELEEKPAEGIRWQLDSAAPVKCRVRLHHDGGDADDPPEADIEIRGREAGTETLVFSCRTAPGVTRTVRVEVLVQ